MKNYCAWHFGVGRCSESSCISIYIPVAALRPHAVTAVNGTVTAAYVYDANGNLSSGAGRVVEWSSFNMPTSIALGASNVAFVYDADHGRIREISSDGKTTISLSPRIDAGIHFEKEIQGTLTSYKHYLYAGGRAIGVYTTRSNGVNDTRYFHADHIGSIAVVTNEAGAVLARYAYDPFGKRITVAGDPHATHHGFTGHEQLDEVGLVHMNGRVYDPVLGRFMSADPQIQAPGNGQSFNRYSYTMNNPLSFTDPSGYLSLGKFVRNLVKAAVIVAAVIYAPQIAASVFQSSYVALATTAANAGAAFTAASALGGAAAGAFVGATVGAVMGGTLQSTLQGAAFGAISGGIAGGVDSYFGSNWNWQRVGANSFAGGVNSELQGGSFRDGFNMSFIVSSLTYGNYSMRQEALQNASLNSDGSNINGDSNGFFGDGKKLAGARRMILNGVYAICDSLMGGCQGAPTQKGDVRSNFFGFAYNPGDLRDKINESFAGPHDWLRNATGSYNEFGNSINFTGARLAVDNVMNYALVLPAAPLAVSGLIMTTPGLPQAMQMRR